ncbi:ABC transporter ATP-binding protein [Tahibacter amnicola]|uniref:ABC transporter ATP-binding protein n=1 Tax=Tahibacter amnicola TaxID=2976241 RepID=A0ABY6BDI5_9GAMM|nr:ABC transporter ATP-binding protein [Tahibacter amnicola]UXI65967.1 ABC transporter ATP-binding protein [Tahibacter amnicola]
MSGDDAVIAVRGLRNAFGAQVVHDALDLDVRRGEILGVIGGSGAGKSVLLRSIVGLKNPDAGRVQFFGQDTTHLRADQRREIDRRFGLLFQDGALFSSLTVLENVEVPLLEYFDLPRNLVHDIALLKIALTGLPLDAAAKYPAQLSGGMRKRAGLARALALDPEILFLDEPTSGLDPVGAAAFDELISTLRNALNLTVFLVTHDLDSLYAICDRVAVLSGGRVAAEGPVNVVEHHSDPWIRACFQGPRARGARGPSPLHDSGVSRGNPS